MDLTTFNEFANVTKCSGEEQRSETVKELLADMDNILGELECEVNMIANAVYKGEKAKKDDLEGTCEAQPIVIILRLYREKANLILKEIVKIREALW